MTSDPTFRALVVDDDPIARKMLVFSLEQEHFVCDAAVDGIHATGLLNERQYDLVVTDLIMPNRHGHSLAVELLNGKHRPVIVVHTSVEEPKLIKDLLARGVDDIVSKPTNYPVLAAKAIGLVKRRFATGSQEGQAAAGEDGDAVCSGSSATASVTPRNLGENLDQRLLGLSKVLPLSRAALDVYQLTNSADSDAEQIAAAAECDASLAAELLHLGNSSYYNPTGEKIDDLERIVVRIGRRRVGELALAASACGATGREAIPWLDMDLIWKRSIAAGVALDQLVHAGKHQGIERGLFLSAIMHPLGRVILATLCPQEHQQLVEECTASGESVSATEATAFGRRHTEIMSQVLEGWSVPAEIIFPLHHLLDPFTALRRLPEPDRTRAELVKCAVLLGNTAIGKWASWDWVEFPPNAVTKRLGIQSVANVVQQTQNDTLYIVHSRTQSATRKAEEPQPEPRRVEYHNRSAGAFDYLGALLPSLGLQSDSGAHGAPDFVLLNCLGAGIVQCKDAMATQKGQELLLVTDRYVAEELGRSEQVFALPDSFGRLRNATQGSPYFTTPAGAP